MSDPFAADQQIAGMAGRDLEMQEIGAGPVRHDHFSDAHAGTHTDPHRHHATRGQKLREARSRADKAAALTGNGMTVAQLDAADARAAEAAARMREALTTSSIQAGGAGGGAGHKKDAAWAQGGALTLSARANAAHDASAENNDRAEGAPNGIHMKRTGLVLSDEERRKREATAAFAAGDGGGGNANSFSCDGCYESMFSEEDRSNPLRCCFKALCYVLCAPCILGYVALRACCRGVVRAVAACFACMGRCCDAFNTCLSMVLGVVGRFLHWATTPLRWLAKQVHEWLLQPLWRGLVCVCSTIWSAIKAAWAAFSKWLLQPLWRAIACVCTSIWSAITAAWEALCEWVLEPLWRAIACVCISIWSAIKAAWGAFSKWLLQPLGRAIACVCTSSWSAIRCVGRAVRDCVLVPICCVRDHVIKPLVAAVACVLRFVRDGFFLPVWRGVKAGTAAVTAVVLAPIRMLLNAVEAIFDFIRSIFAPRSRPANEWGAHHPV